MDVTPRKIGLSSLLILYGLVLVISSLGTYLAYHGPLSSLTWQKWGLESFWIRDVLRVVVAMLAALFVFWHMRVIGRAPQPHSNLKIFLPQDRLERIFSAGLAVTLAFFVLVLQANSFKNSSNLSPDSSVAAEIWKPYIPYMAYVVGFWFGVVWPVFIVLTRYIRRDRQWRRTSSRNLNKLIERCSSVPLGNVSQVFDEMRIAFHFYVMELKVVAERYVVLLVAATFILLYEQVTSSSETITKLAADLGKTIMWLILGPALIGFIVFIAIGYQSTTEKINDALGILIRRLQKGKQKTDVVEKIMATREYITWDKSPASFVFAIIKSANVSIPLVLSITGYVANALTEGAWLDVFLPTWIRGAWEGVMGTPGPGD